MKTQRVNAARIIFVLALALLASAGAGFVWVSPARADVTISVSPSLLEFKAAPGNVGEERITVFNDGDEPFGVIAGVSGYGGAPEELSATGWVTVTPENFDLAPGESREVTVDINVPGDASSGGRYANVTFRTSAKSSGASGTGVSGQLGVPQLFTVRGEEPIRREAVIDRILPVLLPDGTVGFQAVFNNPGNIHYFPRGTLDVSCEGGPSETLQIPQSTAVVPGVERLVNVDGALDIPPGANCDTRVEADYAAGQQPADGELALATGELAFAPNARLSIPELEATERPGRSPNFRLVLDNTGELLLNPGVRWDVFSTDGEQLGSATPASPPSVEPGEQEAVETEFPGRLGPGEYILRASAVYGPEIAEKQINFRLGGAAPEARPGAPEVEGSFLTWWMIVLLILLLIVLLALAIRYLPPLKPVRRKLARAWKAMREPEE